jgi:hypothetical protein
MNLKKCALYFAVAFASTLSAFAEDVAAPEGVCANQTIEYYFKGAAVGPILLNTKLCQKVDLAKGPTQYECSEAMPAPIKKGGRVTIVTTFLVPMDATYDDVSVQFLHEGTVRSTKDLKLSTALRYRGLATETLNKPGKWEIKVLRGGKELHTDALTVEE